MHHRHGLHTKCYHTGKRGSKSAAGVWNVFSVSISGVTYTSLLELQFVVFGSAAALPADMRETLGG